MGLLKNFASNIFNPKVKQELLDIEKYTFDKAKKFIENKISEITNNQLNDRGLKTQEVISRHNRMKKFEAALETAPVGDVLAKQYIKDYLGEFLTNKTYGYCIDESNINYIINFDNEQSLSVREKFDILLTKYKKEYEYNALEEIIERYKLADSMKEEDGQLYYCITKEDIENIYAEEGISLNFEDKLEVIVQRIYSDIIGLSVIDDIRDQYIDGVSGGVSGVPEKIIVKLDKLEYYERQMMNLKIPRNYDSVWIFYKGISIHLKFLSFGNSKELQRVCENIYLYGEPGQFSIEDGFKINEMADQSRVVVFRPPFSESWCFFVRKFDIPDTSLEYLITGENAELAIKTISYLMMGAMVTAITGVQGAGKTTLLFAAVEKIYEKYNLRVIESEFFEMHLQKRFHNRNIVSTKNISDEVDEQAAINALKKTDGDVTLCPEVATAKAAAGMIQVARKASFFTVFCHHALKFVELVDSLKEDLLSVGLYKNEELAEKRIVNVLNFNIHVEKTPEGVRYIERLTECIPIDDRGEILIKFREAKTYEEKQALYMEAMIRQAEGKKLYDYKDIIVYDLEEKKYKVVNRISDNNLKAIRKNLLKKDKEGFDEFIRSNFPVKDGEISA